MHCEKEIYKNTYIHIHIYIPIYLSIYLSIYLREGGSGRGLGVGGVFDGSPRLSAFMGVFGDTLVRVSRNCGHFWRALMIRIILFGGSTRLMSADSWEPK